MSSLRNKFGEALYKDRMSYERELNRRLDRIERDKVRVSHNMDAASQVFLNNAKERRDKWTDYDHKYRKYYRTICRGTQAKKFDSLKKCLDLSKLGVMEDDLQYRYLLLQRELELLEIEKLKDQPQVMRIENADNSQLRLPYIKQIPVHIYSNPNAQSIEDDFNSLYGRYSESDISFLQNFPAKSELMNTKVGKEFSEAEQRKFYNIRNAESHFKTIQKSATTDDRFSVFVKSLDRKNMED